MTETTGNGCKSIVIIGEFKYGRYWAKRESDNKYLSLHKALENGPDSPAIWTEVADYNHTINTKDKTIFQGLVEYVLAGYRAAIKFESSDQETKQEL